MKLIYRGVSYDTTDLNPLDAGHKAVEPFRAPYDLRYRGVTYRVDPTREAEAAMPLERPTVLTYRGVAYRLDGMPPQVNRPSAKRPRTNLWPRLEQLYQRSDSDQLHQIHQGHIYRNIQRRLQAAQAQGNQGLVHQLEQELRQMA
jgi:hypothetical protein